MFDFVRIRHFWASQKITQKVFMHWKKFSRRIARLGVVAHDQTRGSMVLELATSVLVRAAKVCKRGMVGTLRDNLFMADVASGQKMLMVGTRFGAIKPSTATPHEAQRPWPRHIVWRRLPHCAQERFITRESFPNTELRAPLTGASARGAHLQAASPPSVGRPEHPTAPRAASQRGAEKNIVLCKNDRH